MSHKTGAINLEIDAETLEAFIRMKALQSVVSFTSFSNDISAADTPTELLDN